MDECSLAPSKSGDPTEAGREGGRIRKESRLV